MFDFDKVAELPTQVAPLYPTSLPALACSTCAHLLVAHFKPVRPSVCPAFPCQPAASCDHTWGRSRAFHTSLNFEQATAHPAPVPVPSLSGLVVRIFFALQDKVFRAYTSRAPPSPHTQIHTHSVGYTSIINQYSSIFVRRSLPLD